MSLLDLTREPTTDPIAIYRQRDGLYGVDLLTAALARFDFFTWLAKNPSNKAAICQHFGFHDRPVDVMLTLFTAMELIEQHNGVFKLTKSAEEFLVGDSPWCLAPYFASLKERPVCKDYEIILRTDKPANWGSLKTELEWAKAMETEAFAKQFTAAMDCRGAYLGRVMAKKLDLKNHHRLLDIAGGSGIYACSLVATHPHLQATVFEKPPVDQVAQRMITQRGCADKVNVVAGEMFEGVLPTDCDVHLISNVLHDWDFPKVRQLLAKSYAALPPGGMLIVHDVHINEDKTGPLPNAQYSALLMSITEGKCYSTAEMRTLLTETGFTAFEFTPTAADRSFITVLKPK